MDFREAENYLYSLGNEVETMKLGLENITALLSALGDPQKNYVKVQVAGTNGKGSVCAFLDSICREAGIKTGLFTSPHLISIRERIRIGGEDISQEEFARLASVVRESSEKLLAAGTLERMPTFFEQITAIGLLAFADAKVALAILETGLGGRFDATTAACAEIAAITRIDLDHQEYLGDTIEKIAAEKAAIIHSVSSVVIGRQPDTALEVILDRCRELGVEPTSERYKPWTVAPSGHEKYRVDTTRYFCPDVSLGLKGRHQVENAETAINIVQALEFDQGLEIEDTLAVPVGLESARHPGRLEYIGNVLLDGAHNPSGARALRAYLDEFETRPVTLVFGAMKGKVVEEVLEAIAPKASTIILTKPRNTRSLSPETILRSMPTAIDREKLMLTGSVAEALEQAFPISSDGVVLVTGSLYLVGEARQFLLEKVPI